MTQRGCCSIFVLMLLLSCDENEIAEKSSFSYFTLAEIKGPNPNGRAYSSGEVFTDFNLGDVKASKEFYFLLGNGGTNSIFDIELETNNSDFTITPQNISLLEGNNSTSNVVIPLISLGVIHGLMLNGVGYTELLPMGENEVTLTIRGKTIENGASVILESDFVLVVNAKQMDVTLYSEDDEIDFANPVGHWIGFEFESGLPSLPGYRIEPTNFKIKNTGNVDLTISLTHTLVEDTTIIKLVPNQIKSIGIPAPVDTDYYLGILSIDGKGTIADRSRVPLGTNGKGYLIIEHNY